MTPSELARALHEAFVQRHLAGGDHITKWENLPKENQERLIREAEKLQAFYASDHDAPSRGIR